MLTQITFRSRSSQSPLSSSQVELMQSSSNPRVWYGWAEIEASNTIVTALNVRVTVQNNLGFRTTMETFTSLGMLIFIPVEHV